MAMTGNGSVCGFCIRIKEGNVWCLTKSMFQETTCLGDVIMDIHRMLTEDDPEGLTYLYRLE